MVSKRSISKRSISKRSISKRSKGSKGKRIRNKKLVGGEKDRESESGWLSLASGTILPDGPSNDIRGSMEARTGDRDSQFDINPNEKLSPEAIPTGIISGLVGMLVVGIGVLVITQTVGKHHS